MAGVAGLEPTYQGFGDPTVSYYINPLVPAERFALSLPKEHGSKPCVSAIPPSWLVSALGVAPRLNRV